MKVVIVRKEHECCDCDYVIKVGKKALCTWLDGGAYAVRRYRCFKCAETILKRLLKEVSL